MSSKGSRAKRIIGKTAAVLLALLVWQAAAMALNQKILLASPISVAARLRILIGFFIFPPYTFRFYPFKPEVIATPLRINFCEMRYKISSGNMLIPHAASF